MLDVQHTDVKQMHALSRPAHLRPSHAVTSLHRQPLVLAVCWGQGMTHCRRAGARTHGPHAHSARQPGVPAGCAQSWPRTPTGRRAPAGRHSSTPAPAAWLPAARSAGPHPRPPDRQAVSNPALSPASNKFASNCRVWQGTVAILQWELGFCASHRSRCIKRLADAFVGTPSDGRAIEDGCRTRLDTLTKSSQNSRGSPYLGSGPNRAMTSQARSTAHDSVCTRLCKIARLLARLPPLPSLGMSLGLTSLTCAGTKTHDIHAQTFVCCTLLYGRLSQTASQGAV